MQRNLFVTYLCENVRASSSYLDIMRGHVLDECNSCRWQRGVIGDPLSYQMRLLLLWGEIASAEKGEGGAWVHWEASPFILGHLPIQVLQVLFLCPSTPKIDFR